MRSRTSIHPILSPAIGVDHLLYHDLEPVYCHHQKLWIPSFATGGNGNATRTRGPKFMSSIPFPRSFSAHHQRLAKQAKKKRVKESKIGAGGLPGKDGEDKGGKGGGDSANDRRSMKKGKGSKPKMTKEERRAKYTEKCGLFFLRSTLGDLLFARMQLFDSASMHE